MWQDNKLGRLMAVLVLTMLVPACGGGGGGGGNPAPPPVVLLSEDFSEGNTNNWNSNMTLLASGGNPGACGAGADATTVANFSFSGGLTVSWDYYFPPTWSGGSSIFGGVDSGVPAGIGYGVGIGLGHVGNLNWECYINGTIPFQAAFGPAQPSWTTLKVVILPSGIVQYFADGVLLYTSIIPVNFSSPRDVIMRGQVDNVLVTSP